MSKYYFTARSPTGDLFKGYHKCNDEKELKQYLKETDYSLVRFRKKHDFFTIESSRHIKLKDLLILLEKWSMMIRSGLNFTEAVRISIDSFHNKKLCKILKELHLELTKGKSLSLILQSFKDYFPSYFLMMMSVAEKSGNMKEVLKELIKYYRFENNFKKDVVQALFYPCILTIFAVIIIGVLIYFIIPTFEKIFIEMNVKLPNLTKVLLIGCAFLRNNLIYLIGLGLIIFILSSLLSKTKKGKYYKDYKKVRLSFLKNIYKAMITSKFAVSYKILYDSGITPFKSLEMVSLSFDNLYLIKQMNFAVNEVQKGIKISKAIESLNFFPHIFLETLSVGEEFGALSETLNTLGEIYEEEAWHKLKKVATIIEPIFIIFISLLVVTIIASIYIPLFSLLDGIVNL